MTKFNLQKSFDNHTHNGNDSPKISLLEIEDKLLTNLDFDKPNSINNPSGGGTIDSQARSAISQIISALENLGLIEEN